jgi:NDP-sugar pyrophosphorylase family protein
MRALILAGGEGKRLRPVTDTVPKPMVPLRGRPLLHHTVAQLATSGFDRITLAVRHRAEIIEDYFGAGERCGVAIDYLVERIPLGTAGCLAELDDVDEDRILVCNGDIVTTLDFAWAHRSHRTADGVTVLSTEMSVRLPYGLLRRGTDGALLGYDEKPLLRYPVAMGVCVVSTAALTCLPRPARRLDVPDLVRHVRAGGFTPRATGADVAWVDVGTPADVGRAERILAGSPSVDSVLPAHGAPVLFPGEGAHG